MPDETIAQVAALFGVAPSALRYWDAQGLVRFSRAENGYRVPDIRTLLDICDVLLYRGLGLGVRELRGVPRLGAGELDALLAESERQLLLREEELERARGRVRKRRETIQRLALLRRTPPAPVRARLPAVRLFSFESPADAEILIRDGWRTAAVLEGEGEPLYGVLEPGEPLLRAADESERDYLKGVLTVDCDDPLRHNRERLARSAAEWGRAPGVLVGRYLLTAVEAGRRVDFYEAWMELLDPLNPAVRSI